MKRSRVIITIRTDKIRKIMQNNEKNDPELDAKVDKAESAAFEEYIHQAIARAVESYVTDSDGKFEEDVEGEIAVNYDTETLFSDNTVPELSELGNIDINIRTLPPKSKRRRLYECLTEITPEMQFQSPFDKTLHAALSKASTEELKQIMTSGGYAYQKVWGKVCQLMISRIFIERGLDTYGRARQK